MADAVQRLEQRINAADPRIARIFVEVEPPPSKRDDRHVTRHASHTS